LKIRIGAPPVDGLTDSEKGSQKRMIYFRTGNPKIDGEKQASQNNAQNKETWEVQNQKSKIVVE
jgi:hypothetical protein